MNLKEYSQIDDVFVSGHNACPGCTAAISARAIGKVFGKNSVVYIPACCFTIVSSTFPFNAWNMPFLYSAFENSGACISGIKAALNVIDENNDTTVFTYSGDGAAVDIGLSSLSGAAERNEDVVYICYDNEAYMNCLSLYTNIFTKDGLKKITSVKEGDYVYSFDLSSRSLILNKCIGVFNNGNKDIYQVSTLHRSIKATKNHPFLTLKKNRLIWKTIEELKIGDQVITLKEYSSRYKYMKFLIKKDIFEMDTIKDIKYVGIEPTLDLQVENEHNFIADGFVVHNTGIQRSAATTLGAITTTTVLGKKEMKKNLDEIIRAHNVPYQATLSPSRPRDFIRKLEKAKKIKGFRFLHVLCPCPSGWKFDPSKSIEIARDAVESGMWVLYEIESGVRKITYIPKKLYPVKNYLLKQGRFRHLKDDKKTITTLQRDCCKRIKDSYGKEIEVCKVKDVVIDDHQEVSDDNQFGI